MMRTSRTTLSEVLAALLPALVGSAVEAIFAEETTLSQRDLTSKITSIMFNAAMDLELHELRWYGASLQFMKTFLRRHKRMFGERAWYHKLDLLAAFTEVSWQLCLHREPEHPVEGSIERPNARRRCRNICAYEYWSHIAESELPFLRTTWPSGPPAQPGDTSRERP